MLLVVYKGLYLGNTVNRQLRQKPSAACRHQPAQMAGRKTTLGRGKAKTLQCMRSRATARLIMIFSESILWSLRMRALTAAWPLDERRANSSSAHSLAPPFDFR